MKFLQPGSLSVYFFECLDEAFDDVQRRTLETFSRIKELLEECVELFIVAIQSASACSRSKSNVK